VGWESWWVGWEIGRVGGWDGNRGGIKSDGRHPEWRVSAGMASAAPRRA
jgi:hypothetical protein